MREHVKQHDLVVESKRTMQAASLLLPGLLAMVVDVAPLATALAEAADPAALDYFVCGSPTLVATAFHALELLGVPPDHVRTEQFDMV